MTWTPSARARKMAYSATIVLPLEVGAQTSTPAPSSSLSIASSWNASRGQGRDAANSSLRECCRAARITRAATETRCRDQGVARRPFEMPCSTPKRRVARGVLEGGTCPPLLRLSPAPHRFPFLEERAHAFPEVLAQIAGHDQVSALFGVEPARLQDPAHAFFDRADRQRRVGGDLLGQGLRPRQQPLLRIHDLVQEPDLLRLLRLDQPGREEHLLGAGRAHQLHEQVQGGHREAVAEGARDGNAEPGAGRADPEVAGAGDGEPAACAGAADGGDGGDADTTEGADLALHPLLVLDRILLRLEALELRDVGPGDEGLVPGAGQHHAAQGVVLVGFARDLTEPVVHGEGHRIARLRPVEGQPEDVPPALLDQLGYLSCDRCTLPIALRGSASTNRTDLGHLNLARRSWAKPISSDSVGRSRAGTTKAVTSSPQLSLGSPTTATSATPGCASRTSSTSRG